jgi:hypothetical protein
MTFFYCGLDGCLHPRPRWLSEMLTQAQLNPFGVAGKKELLKPGFALHFR